MRQRVMIQLGVAFVAVAAMAAYLAGGRGGLPLPSTDLSPVLAQQTPGKVVGAAAAYNAPQLDRSTYLWQHDKREIVLFMYKYGPEEWTTAAVFQNAGGAPITLQLEFRDVSRGTVKTASVEVPGYGTKEVTGADVELEEGFRGSLTANGGPAFAVAHHDGKDQNRVAMPAFEAINCAVPMAIQCGSATVYVPQVFKAYQGWDTWLLIKNMELSAAIASNDLRVVLRDLDWTDSGYGERLPAPDTSRGWLPEIRNPIAAGQLYMVNLARMSSGRQASAVITSASGKRMMALAFHTNGSTGQAMAITGIGTAQRDLSLPQVFKNYQDQNSEVLVVNVGPATTKPTVSVRLPGAGGQGFLARKALAIGEGETFKISGLAGLPESLVAGATVTGQNATDQFVAQVVTTNPDTMTTMSYRSLLSGTVCSSNIPPLECGAWSLYAPAVYYDYQGYSSEIQVQNVQAGDTDAIVIITFYDRAGRTVATTDPITIRSQTSTTVDPSKVPGIPRGFVGSAVIESTTQTNIAAVVTEIKKP